MKIRSILYKFRHLSVVLALAALAVLALALQRLPQVPAIEVLPERSFSWPQIVTPSSNAWSAVQRTGTARVESTGPLSKRYRLAGTFFAFGSGNSALARRAIIDDLQSAEQKLVREKETIGDAEVVTIFQDRVVLRADGREEEIWLSFAGSEDGAPTAQSVGGEAVTTEGETVLGVTQFGRRVGESRWVLQRDKLMAYYRELLDDPERLAAIYLSLKPDRNEKRRIQGYYLGTEGEGEFFTAMGLQEGDVIRKVNSMKMTSQSRAEYFLGEFVKNQLNAVVLDIERNEKPEKLIYLIR